MITLGCNVAAKIKALFHPWHGLWKDGLLHLPNGTTRALPGLVPQKMGYGYPVFAVKIPGWPAPTPDAADTAAGRTNLGYALMSGAGKRIYGKDFANGWFDLSGDRTSWRNWIYVDADNIPWIAWPHETDHRDFSSHRINFAPMRAGLLPFSITASFDPALPAWMAEWERWFFSPETIRAIDQQGRRIIFNSGALLTISGSYPSITAAVTMLDTDASTSGGAPVETSTATTYSGTLTRTASRDKSFYLFGVDGALIQCRMVQTKTETLTTSAAADDPAHPDQSWTQTATKSGSDTYQLYVGGNLVDTVSYGVSGTASLDGTGWTVTITTTLDSDVQVKNTSGDSPLTGHAESLSTLEYGGYGMSSWGGDIFFQAVTNCAVGITAYLAASTQTRYTRKIVSMTGAEAAWESVDQCITAHPITGEICVHSSNCCFV